MKLALGTVQFGLPYGISNKNGQTDIEEAEAIIDYAREHGVDTIDTAVAYGQSESCLGKIGVQDFNVVTKMTAIPDGDVNVKAWVFNQAESSLERLKLQKMHAILLHQPLQLINPIIGQTLAESLISLKAEGLVDKIGVSIYSPHELEAVFKVLDLDLVQAPFNVLDRRLLTSGWLGRLHELGVEVHVRSVFLQGLLLFPRQARPAQFNRWQGIWCDWEEYLQATNQTPLEASVRFAAAPAAIARVVVGVDSRAQLAEIFAALQGGAAPAPDHLLCDDSLLLEPSRWKTLSPAVG